MKKLILSAIFIVFMLLISNCSMVNKQVVQQPKAWTNWNGNIYYKPIVEGNKYYFTPTTKAELHEIMQKAAQQNGKVKVHVSGQRHSGSPIVVNNSVSNITPPTQWLIDISCYHDLGKDGSLNMMIDTNKSTVTVNAGVREDELDAFITSHNFMLKTVTAGGFFSIGGMSAVDVHGATVNETNFPGTIESFTVMGPDGITTTYDANSKKFNGISPLQFQRVSLGTLGVITSVTIKLDSRPYKTSLYGRLFPQSVYSKSDFIKLYTNLLFSSKKARVESFYNPYHSSPNVLALYWNVNDNPKSHIYNDRFVPGRIKTACQIAKNHNWGAPLQGLIKEPIVDLIGISAQNSKKPSRGQVMIKLGFDNVSTEMKRAIANNSPMWLNKAAKVIFMSYTIPLPNNKYQGLDVAWDALRAINNVLDHSDQFILAAPAEFRFLLSDDAMMSAAYSRNPKQRYISIEVIGFAETDSKNQYPQNVLNFFANVECRWAKFNGFPHQGKMYGFYNPENVSDNCNQVTGTAPFNPEYLAELKARKPVEINMFKAYQHQTDPNGIFCSKFAEKLGMC